MTQQATQQPTVRVTPTHGVVPPLGVHLVDGGVRVAVLAAHATAVDLCLLDEAPDGSLLERRHPLLQLDYGVWSGFVPDVHEGQRYGLRADGPWDPAAGHRYNPAKLLVDPYARALVGAVQDVPETRGQSVDAEGAPTGERDDRDSAPFVPHGVVVGPSPGDAPVRHPRVPWSDTVVYEAHVRGLTMTLPGVPEELRGTYAGLAHPVTIEHLTSLGVTTIELLPIQAFADEPHLTALGLTNYWGYNTLGFFAPHAAYATAAARAGGPGAVRDEVRGMVQLLHEAGLEVVLDVVYNHTCEGGPDGPQLSWRGLDNRSYYLHDDGNPIGYADVTGTGNSLDFRRPRVIQMALDSLRYWVEEIGVDGFRFDLAVTLGRTSNGFTAEHPFLVALQTDPVLSSAKLIAEPWDIGPGGWQTGQFPPPFSEWNDRFRDAARGFWLADLAAASHGNATGGVREIATRLAGSADLFGMSDPPLVRGPVASVNYITAHDGFTLRDLVTYDHKHNLANGEDNRDGNDNNLSWNHGSEGPAQAEDLELALDFIRRRSQRNLLGTLLLAAGTPMITAGDEIGRTQQGNNNAYCQDGPISWVDWDLQPWQQDLLTTTRYLLALRREHPALRVDGFFMGAPRPQDAPNKPDLTWFDAAGSLVTHDQWHDTGVRTLQMLRRGAGAHAHVLLVINGALSDSDVTLAGSGNTERRWDLVWDSGWETPTEAIDLDTQVHGLAAGETVEVDPFTLQVYVARTAVEQASE